jgi:hypothetical protein
MGHVTTTKATTATAAPFIARWDLDKTYLRTDFDTPGELINAAFERPDQKRTVPGAAALLREFGKAGAHIHILSGSPRQMRSKVEEKLRIDRVRWDALTLKPNISNLLRLRFKALRDQTGYKLPELLKERAAAQGVGDEPPPEILIGDDAEADAFVYSLYADICSGSVSDAQLARVLHAGNLYPDRIEVARRAIHEMRRGPVVRRILIHLDRQSPPSAFTRYGDRVVPFYNYFQAALLAVDDRFIEPVAALRVADTFVQRFRFDADALARSFFELGRRHSLSPELAERLRAALGRYAQEMGAYDALAATLEAIANNEPETTAAKARQTRKTRPNPTIDYVALAREYRAGKNRRHRRARG